MTAPSSTSTTHRRRTTALIVLVAAALAVPGFAFAQTNPPPPATATHGPPVPPATAAAPPAAAATNGSPAAATNGPTATATPAATPATSPAPAPSGFILPPQPPPVGATQGANEKPGFFGEIGHWWDDSVANFKAKMKEQQSKIDEFNKKSAEAAKDAAAATSQAMKNAADAMVRIPASRVIEVHEVCATAGNGAPDCETAATNVCKGKGFNAGQPLDSRTAEKCTESLWMSGQPPSRDCAVETVLLRAACE